VIGEGEKVKEKREKKKKRSLRNAALARSGFSLSSFLFSPYPV
jgi:hypothetical protein